MKIGAKGVLILVFTVVISLLAMGSGSYAAENGLIAHYKFNGNFNDSSGNNYNGVVVGDVSLMEDSVVGKHAVFNGGYINLPGSSGLNLGNNFTISAWVLVDSSRSSGNKTLPILSKLNDKGTHNVFHAYARGTFSARMDAQFTKGGNYLVTGGPFDNYATGNHWTHLLFSCDGERLHFYVNGVMKGSSRDLKSGETIVSSSGAVRIGTANDTNSQHLFFLGKMADLRIYNRALSLEEIRALQ